MADPVDPIPPATPPSIPATGARTGSTGLPTNVAAALACIPLIGGIIFYILEKHDQFVRFYAMQSIIFGGVWFLFSLASAILQWIVSVIPFAGRFFSMVWAF